MGGEMKKQRGTGAISSVEELGVLMAEKEEIKMMACKEHVCLSCKGGGLQGREGDRGSEVSCVRRYITGDKLRGSWEVLVCVWERERGDNDN